MDTFTIINVLCLIPLNLNNILETRVILGISIYIVLNGDQLKW
jgi:hypothetical protein